MVVEVRRDCEHLDEQKPPGPVQPVCVRSLCSCPCGDRTGYEKTHLFNDVIIADLFGL